MRVEPANLDAPDVQALLTLHLDEARQDACSHAFDDGQLRGPNLSVFSARDDRGALMGFAALKRLSDLKGEIKSVRTHPDHLRKGVSSALMDHIEAFARTCGLTRLMLETHPTEAYKAARTLYERRGYAYRGPFGGYSCSDKSVFMEKTL